MKDNLARILSIVALVISVGAAIYIYHEITSAPTSLEMTIDDNGNMKLIGK